MASYICNQAHLAILRCLMKCTSSVNALLSYPRWSLQHAMIRLFFACMHLRRWLSSLIFSYTCFGCHLPRLSGLWMVSSWPAPSPLSLACWAGSLGCEYLGVQTRCLLAEHLSRISYALFWVFAYIFTNPNMVWQCWDHDQFMMDLLIKRIAHSRLATVLLHRYTPDVDHKGETQRLLQSVRIRSTPRVLLKIIPDYVLVNLSITDWRHWHLTRFNTSLFTYAAVIVCAGMLMSIGSPALFLVSLAAPPASYGCMFHR